MAANDAKTESVSNSEPAERPDNGALTGVDNSRRSLFVVASVFLFGVLLVAWLLKPDARGFGTHEELGLPPCMTMRLLHIPCPFCGMTTAFSLMAHGRIASAFRVQPAGALGYLATVLAAIGSIGIALTGRQRGLHFLEKHRTLLCICGICIIIMAWIYKISTTTWRPPL